MPNIKEILEAIKNDFNLEFPLEDLRDEGVYSVIQESDNSFMALYMAGFRELPFIIAKNPKTNEYGIFFHTIPPDPHHPISRKLLTEPTYESLAPIIKDIVSSHKKIILKRLFYLISSGDENKIDEIRRILRTNPDLINKRNAHSYTALAVACEALSRKDNQASRKQILDVLMEFNPDIHLKCNGRTPYEILLINKERIDNQLFDEISGQLIGDQVQTDVSSKDGTQKLIIALRNALGYKTSEEGICNGYAHMAMQAFLVDTSGEQQGLKTFLDRIEWIKDVGVENVVLFLDAAREKIKNRADDQLTDDEKKALEVSALYDGIELYQNTRKIREDNPELFNNNEVINQAPELAAKLVMSNELEEQGGIVNAYREIGRYSQDDLITYFTTLAEKASTPFSLNLAASNHAICVAYNADTKQFTLIDANNCSPDREIVQVFGHDSLHDLAKAIQSAFFIEDDKQQSVKINMRTNMFVHNKDMKEAAQFVEQWKNDLLPMRNEGIRQYKEKDAGNVTVVEHIKRNADVDALSQIKAKEGFFKRHRRAIIAGVLGTIITTAAIAITVATLGAAAPLVAAIAVPVGAAVGVVSGFIADPKEAMKTKVQIKKMETGVMLAEKSRGEVGEIIKPEYAQPARRSTLSIHQSLGTSPNSVSTSTDSEREEATPVNTASSSTPASTASADLSPVTRRMKH